MLRGIIRAASFAIILTYGWGAEVYAATEKRVALVIGNSAYVHMGALANPRNDAELIAGTLQRAGFEVISGIDLGKSAMRDKIDEFTEAAFDAKVALIYYAGHGMQIDGQNYFIPVDSKIESVPQVRTQTINIDAFMKALPPEPAVNILILDACRDNPLSRSLQVAVSRSGRSERGLANIQASQSNHGEGGLLIAFATDPDDVAADGSGINSPYSAALARHLTEPGVEIQGALTRVRAEVTQNTGGKQRPWANASLSREVFLGEPATTTRGEIEQQPVAIPGLVGQNIDWEVEQTLWDEASKRNTVTHYEFYLKRYPNGRFAPIAILNLDQLKAEQAAQTAATEQSAGAPAVSASAEQDRQQALIAEQQLALLQQQNAAVNQQQLALAQPQGEADVSLSKTRAASPIILSEMMKQMPGTPDTDATIGLAYDRDRAIDLQLRLNALGFDVGGFDGNIGRKSRTAIATWQGQLEMVRTSYLTMDQYNFLVTQTEPLMQGVRARYETQKAEATRRSQVKKQRVAQDYKRRKPEGRVQNRQQSGNGDAFGAALFGGVIGGIIGGAMNR